jgi:hypothetical protein
MSSRYIS